MSSTGFEHNINTLTSTATVRKIRKRILLTGKIKYQKFPWRDTENKWHALIAEIMLQRTRTSSVLPVYLSFTEKFPEPQDLAEARLNEIEDYIRPLGLLWRAPLLQQLAKEITCRNGEIPVQLQDLLSLPGVGSYVAAAWLSFHAGKRSVIVDANIVRWICRMIDVETNGETRRKKWLINIIEIITPQKNVKNFSYAMLDFTMSVCTKIPKCSTCIFKKDICLYSCKNEVDNEII